VGGAHGVGEEANIGGSGQQICVAEVTYVLWWRWRFCTNDSIVRLLAVQCGDRLVGV
jgi:hypothetical protein